MRLTSAGDGCERRVRVCGVVSLGVVGWDWEAGNYGIHVVVRCRKVVTELKAERHRRAHWCRGNTDGDRSLCVVWPDFG